MLQAPKPIQQATVAQETLVERARPLNIADPVLKKSIQRECHNKKFGFKAYTYIEKCWRIDLNETRATNLAQERATLIEEGMAKMDLPTLKTFTEELFNMNRQLEGTPHEMADALAVTTVLDAIHVHDDGVLEEPVLVLLAQLLHLLLELVRRHDHLHAMAPDLIRVTVRARAP